VLHELDPKHYDSIYPLMGDLPDYNFAIGDLLDGTRPGKVYVDDAENPQSVFMYSGAWYYLGGTPENVAFNRAIHRLIMHPDFMDAPFRGLPHEFFLNCNAEWRDQFPVIFLNRSPIEVARRHYFFDALPDNWGGNLPKGYEIRPLGKRLLEDEALKNREHVERWIHQTWTGNTDSFTERGIGVCLVQGDAIVCWCLTVAIAGDACELGIETHWEHRRNGLGTMVAMATVDACLRAGFSTIDWHCDEVNAGSWSVAEKAGFVQDREYTAYLYLFDPMVHFAAAGNFRLAGRDYDAALSWYKKALAINPDAPDWVCFMVSRAYAALGAHQQALGYLNTAIDKGWVYPNSLKESREFDALRDTPEWEGILAQMQDKIDGVVDEYDLSLDGEADLGKANHSP
jgi:RimJ/RimL family protein N-acetyltransferase